MNPLERLWKDKMDVYRFASTKVNGVTKSAKGLLSSNVKCHYSKGNLADVGENGTAELVSSHSLFCSTHADIKEGDEVIVTQRNGKRVTLTVGEGFPYSSYIQFSVKRADNA